MSQVGGRFRNADLSVTDRPLSRILAVAVEAGYLLRNPCTVKGAGQERAPEMRFATVAQVMALAAAVPARYRALVLVAAYGGLRWGELVGLTVRRSTCCTAGCRPWSRWPRSTAGSSPGAAQDRRRPSGRDPPLGRRRPGRAPGRVRRARPRRAGVPGAGGRLPAPLQLPPPLVGAGHPGGRGGGPALPRPLPHRRHPGPGRRRQHPGADGAHGHTSPQVALRYQHVMAGRDQAIAAALDELVHATNLRRP